MGGAPGVAAAARSAAVSRKLVYRPCVCVCGVHGRKEWVGTGHNLPIASNTRLRPLSYRPSPRVDAFYRGVGVGEDVRRAV